MTRENVMKFEELLRGDKVLQAKLDEATSVYTVLKSERMLTKAVRHIAKQAAMGGVAPKKAPVTFLGGVDNLESPIVEKSQKQ